MHGLEPTGGDHVRDPVTLTLRLPHDVLLVVQSRGEGADRHPVHLRGEVLVAHDRAADGLGQLVRCGALDHVPVDPGAQQRQDLGLICCRGEDDDPRLWAERADELRGVDAPAGHAQVEQDDVRMEVVDRLHRAVDVDGRAGHVEALQLEHRLEVGDHVGLVVRHQHADGTTDGT